MAETNVFLVYFLLSLNTLVQHLVHESTAFPVKFKQVFGR